MAECERTLSLCTVALADEQAAGAAKDATIQLLLKQRDEAIKEAASRGEATSPLFYILIGVAASSALIFTFK